MAETKVKCEHIMCDVRETMIPHGGTCFLPRFENKMAKAGKNVA